MAPVMTRACSVEGSLWHGPGGSGNRLHGTRPARGHAVAASSGTGPTAYVPHQAAGGLPSPRRRFDGVNGCPGQLAHLPSHSSRSAADSLRYPDDSGDKRWAAHRLPMYTAYPTTAANHGAGRCREDEKKATAATVGEAATLPASCQAAQGSPASATIMPSACRMVGGGRQSGRVREARGPLSTTLLGGGDPVPVAVLRTEEESVDLCLKAGMIASAA